MKPLVTVGIALYNHADYIFTCIDSVLSQTYEKIELIIIDDGSSDNSYDVAKKAIENYSGTKKTSLITRPNKGMCATLNEIAKRANGKYISFIGSDDYWGASKIEEQVCFLQKNETLALVHSNSHKIDSAGKIIGKLDFKNKKNSGKIFEEIIKGKGGINTPSHLYRTSVYEKIGYYDETFGFEDTDFWLRLTKEYEVGFMDKYHTYYRWHEENLSKKDNMLKFYNEEIIKIFQKNIDDEELKKYAVKKMYRKSFLRALRSLKLGYFFKYLYKYITCK